MLIPPRKTSTSVDLAAKLEKFLQTSQSQEIANQHKDACKILGELRAQTLHATEPSEQARELGVRYWAQLALLDKRINFTSAAIQFQWHDAFLPPSTFNPGQGRITNSSVHLEMASVLFNAGVMAGAQAVREHSAGGVENLKVAAAVFRKGAGMFAMAKEVASKVDGAISMDIGPDALTMLEQLYLGHAQRCFYEKAVKDNMKHGTLAKLCAGVAECYASAHAPIANASSDLAKHIKQASWSPLLTMEMLYFKAQSHLHYAQGLTGEGEVRTQLGKEVAHMRKALESVEHGLKMAKQSKSARAAEFDSLRTKLNQEIKSAIDENNKIYHMEIESHAPDPEAKIMVKTEALPEPLTVLGGNDRFASLIPDSVRSSALAYAARRQDSINLLVKEMQSDTEAVRGRLLRITPQLEAVDSTEPGLPSRLRERIPPIQQKGGLKFLTSAIQVCLDMKQEIAGQVDKSVRTLDQEERSDDELRQKFGARWTRVSSKTVNAPLRKDINEAKKTLSLASDADDKVYGMVEEKRGVLEKLSLGLDQLDAMVSGAGDKAYEAMDRGTSTAQLQQQAVALMNLVRGVERFMDEREGIRAKLLAKRDQEDPARALTVLILAGKSSDEAFAELLSGYSMFGDQFRQNASAVQDYMGQLEDGHGQFLAQANASAEMKRREDAIKQVSEAMEAFETLSSHVREGTEFYTLMQDKMNKIDMRVADFKCARDLQKDDLFTSIQDASAKGTDIGPPSQPPPPAALPAAMPAMAPMMGMRSAAPDTSRDEEIARQLAGLPAAPPPARPAPAPAPISRPPPDTSGDEDLARKLAAELGGASLAPRPTPPPAAQPPIVQPSVHAASVQSSMMWAPPEEPPPAHLLAQPTFAPAPVAPPPPPQVDDMVLPEGWEKKTTAEGEVYYVDHINKTTSWDPPAGAHSGFVNARPI